MTYELIENPARELVERWGTLAYVSEKDREHIMKVSHGRFKPIIEELEKRIKTMKRERDRIAKEKKKVENRQAEYRSRYKAGEVNE